jgi:hypothetical protein
MIEDSLSTSMVSQLVEKLKTIEGDIKSVNECVNRNQQENYTQLSLKMRELKSEYIEDVKTILTSNVSEKISPLLKDYNQTFLDKIIKLIDDDYKIVINIDPVKVKIEINCYNSKQILNIIIKTILYYNI